MFMNRFLPSSYKLHDEKFHVLEKKLQFSDKTSFSFKADMKR